MKKFRDYDFDGFFDKADKKIRKKIGSRIFAIDEAVNAVTAAKKNAKIAGINKLISFSRKETGWLELKFREGSVDKIITHAPEIGRRVPEQKAVRVYEELFWQAEHMLKKGGLVVVLTRSPGQMKKAAEKRGFRAREERSVSQGKMDFTALAFSR
jgi:23S rRNA G2445 N2-methylase RlmL